MGMGAGFHYHPKITPAISKNKFKCKSLATHSHKKPPDCKHCGAAKFGYFISSIWRARLMARVMRRW